MFGALRDAGFDVETRNHAEAILSADFAAEAKELITALLEFRISDEELIGSGGGEAASTQRLRRRLAEVGWRKHNFHVQLMVDGKPFGDGTSHEIDHVRATPSGTLALEIEWNNKDPFFDRDLENFQRLHAQSIISLGVIVTRGFELQANLHRIIANVLRRGRIMNEAELLKFGMKERTSRQRQIVAQAVARGEAFEDAFARQFVSDKFGQATTHWTKLVERTARGVGNPCPLLLIGLPFIAVETYSAANPEL